MMWCHLTSVAWFNLSLNHWLFMWFFSAVKGYMYVCLLCIQYRSIHIYIYVLIMLIYMWARAAWWYLIRACELCGACVFPVLLLSAAPTSSHSPGDDMHVSLTRWLSLCVLSPVMDWQPVWSAPCHSPNVNWDRFQPPTPTLNWISS